MINVMNREKEDCKARLTPRQAKFIEQLAALTPKREKNGRRPALPLEADLLDYLEEREEDGAESL